MVHKIESAPHRSVVCGEENKPVKFIKEVVSCPKEWPEEGKIGNRVPKEGPLPAEAAQAGPSLHLEQHGCGQNAERMVYGLCARLLAVLVAPYSTPIQALSVTGHTAPAKSSPRILASCWPQMEASQGSSGWSPCVEGIPHVLHDLHPGAWLGT